jgi:cytochrome c553
MKTIVSTILVLILVALAGIAGPQASVAPQSSSETAPQVPYRIVGTMSQLMVDIIYPTSNDIFYIVRKPPSNEGEWEAIQRSALTLAESANLLVMPGRARDQDKWIADARLLLDAGNLAFRAARAKDYDAIVALNEQLVTACTTCHQDYRPNYRRRR